MYQTAAGVHGFLGNIWYIEQKFRPKTSLGVGGIPQHPRNMGVLGKNYLHTVGTNVVLKLVVGLVISVVTARALGPSGRGEYNLLVLIITTLTTVLNFGIPASNTYFVAQKTIARERLLRASFVVALCVSLISFSLLVVLYETNLLKYLFPVDHLTTSVVVSLAIIPVVFFNLFAQGIILGENRIYFNNYVYLAGQSSLALLLTVAFVLHRLTVPLAIIFYALNNLVSFVMILIAYRRVLFSAPLLGMRWSEYTRVLKFSTPVQTGNIIQYFNYRLGTFLVNAFLGTVSVGLFFLAVSLVEILWVLSTSMASVLLPTVAGNHAQSKAISVKAASASLGVTLIAGLFACLVAPYAIVGLFGKEFAGSVAPFFILLPGITIFSIANVLAAYITGVGKPGYNTAISLISLVFTITLNALLIPRFGIGGAAFASTVSYFITSVLTLAVFARLSSLTWREALASTLDLRADLRNILNRARLIFPGANGTSTQ
ncbi:MAG TPA: polysaccharide biosynthesis C-terminal domain-containing protein [Bacteroidota bacterium]|nr:polysaccharide biosynthesis C-terminal domain-containing protein [Bacteroidota bacterium]